MLKSRDMAVLDISSEYMSLIVCDTRSQYPVVSAYAKQKYSGFQDGEFLSPDEVYPTIKSLIESVYLRFKIKVKKIFVSIPAEFTCIVNKSVEKDINKRVKEKDIEELFEIGNTYQSHNIFEAVDMQGIYYKTNSNPKRLIDPVGEECDTIFAKLCYILAERYFTDTIREVMKTLKLKYDFVSSVISQIKHISEKNKIDVFQHSIHIDMGYLTTAVCYFIGNRPVDLKTFSIGGGSAAGDITLVTDIPFSHSYKLYKKANLNLQPKDDDLYYIHSDKEDFSYEVKTINAILEERIYNIGEHLAAAIYNTGVDMQQGVQVYLSGCSLCENRGVREILEAAIGNKISIEKEDLFDNVSTENLSVGALIK
ncbi:MAG: hypothetical protein ACOCWI_01935 [Bacillota bacterium]